MGIHQDNLQGDRMKLPRDTRGLLLVMLPKWFALTILLIIVAWVLR